MPKMPKILRECALPIGTRVEVHKYREANPFQAIVRAYDMGHSKFEVGHQYMGDRYADDGTWVFPREIAGYCLPGQDEWWRPDPMPKPPEPMPWGDYFHLEGQPVEACYTEMPDHIYGEPELQTRHGILEGPDALTGQYMVRAFDDRSAEGRPWESVRALDYAELTARDLRDWFDYDPKAAMRFSFHAFAREERVEAAREAAIEDMRH